MIDSAPIMAAVERIARKHADAVGRRAEKTRAFTEGGTDVFPRWDGNALGLPESGFNAEYRADGEAWVGDFMGRLGAMPT